MGCLFPMESHGKVHPCGVCPNCLVRYTDNWVFRVMHELNVCQTAVWVRFSYNDDNLRFANPSGLSTVVKRDWQLFMKRLRKLYPDNNVRYFMCGEYGSRTQRPHYHAFLFNIGSVDDSVMEQNLVNCWGFGDIYIDPRPLNSSCVSYTVGYMNKKRFVFRNSRCGRQREFLLMSKKLGLSYLTDTMVDWHRSSVDRAYVVLNGKRMALPRYFFDKIFNKDFRDGHPDFFVEREQALDDGVRAQHERVYREYVRNHGSADGFKQFLEQSRLQAIANFQKKSSTRSDV